MAKRSDQNFSASASRAKASGKHYRLKRPRISISRSNTPNVAPDRGRSLWARITAWFNPWHNPDKSFEKLNRGSKEAKRSRKIEPRGQASRAPRIYNQRRK